MAEEIVPGVYGISISMSYVRAYLLEADGGLALVDTGLPGRRDFILAELSRLGRQAADVKHILITHYHVDHTGSLAALKDATGAAVYVHPGDAPYVRGEKPPEGPFPRTFLQRVIGTVMARMGPAAPAAAVDHEVSDGEQLGIADGLRVIYTPGHTPGHTSLLTPRHGGVLFVGDAAANIFGRLGPPFGVFTHDMDQAIESMRKLAELEFEVACFGHGRVLKGKASAAFRRYLEKAALAA
ncbi:MAG: MBL fold metallo-hydrolase [Chloroflexi bacterium]|nr:MBL fold metallo-hydrolase [Chloroflexota bacterium]